MANLYERHKDEQLSDNTHADYCEQCKKCVNWGKSGTPWDNRHDKSNCEMYPYPSSMKPMDVINNLAPCPHRKEMEVM